MKLTITVRNISDAPLPFSAWIYHRTESIIKGANGRGTPKLEKVSSIDWDGEPIEPGAVLSFSVDWAWTVKPTEVHWKAPPEISQKFEVLEWTVDGVSIVQPSSVGNTRVFG